MIEFLIQQAWQHADLYGLILTIGVVLWFKLERQDSRAAIEALIEKQAIKELDRKVMFLWDVIGRRGSDKLQFLITEWEKTNERNQRDSVERKERP